MDEREYIYIDNAEITYSDITGESAGADFSAAGNGSSGNTGSRKPKKPHRKSMIALLLCACILTSGIAGFGGAAAALKLAGNDMSISNALGSLFGEESPQIAQDSSDGGGSFVSLAASTGSKLTVQQIIEQNEDAVVEIRTESVTYDNWYGQYVTEGAGSGVIILSNGYILTNNHVIEDATKITVTLHDGTEYEAELIGSESNEDVAVIKIDAEDLTTAVCGDSDNLQVGDLAVAIGNPLGKLGGTATCGIISALDRQITVDGKEMTLLQTDAAINPGNSGGGLFDGSGKLIGLVVAKSTGSDVEGLGFAIPINTAMEKAQYIIDHADDYAAERQQALEEQQKQEAQQKEQQNQGGSGNTWHIQIPGFFF